MICGLTHRKTIEKQGRRKLMMLISQARSLFGRYLGVDCRFPQCATRAGHPEAVLH